MPLNLSAIQALCFDVDGTLRDTDDQLVLSIESALKPFSFFFPRRTRPFARWLVMAVENPGNYLVGLSDRLQIDGLLARLSDEWERRLRLRAESPLPAIPGVCEMLNCLSERFPMAVISARKETATMRFLEQHNLNRCFQVIVSGQTCRRTKPHPEPVLYAARHLGVPPESCLMIGDTIVDIRSGRRAGAQTVGVLCGFGERKELEREGADLILESTADILTVLTDKKVDNRPFISMKS